MNRCWAIDSICLYLSTICSKAIVIRFFSPRNKMLFFAHYLDWPHKTMHSFWKGLWNVVFSKEIPNLNMLKCITPFFALFLKSVSDLWKFLSTWLKLLTFDNEATRWFLSSWKSNSSSGLLYLSRDVHWGYCWIYCHWTRFTNRKYPFCLPRIAELVHFYCPFQNRWKGQMMLNMSKTYNNNL